METNPFAAPQAPVERTPPAESDDPRFLRAVAKYQRGVLFCILLTIISIVVMLMGGPGLAPWIGWGAFVIRLVGVAFVLLLAIKLYGGAGGILLGLLAIVPLVGLLVLLMVNGKATSRLKKNGIRVGLLGARPNDLPGEV